LSDTLRRLAQAAGPVARFFSVGSDGEATMSETGPGLPCRLLMFPNLRQAHSWDCGATVAESVLQFYGFDVRGDETIKALKTDRSGTDVGPIMKFLKAKGLKVWAGRATLADVRACVDKGMPAILTIQAYPDKPSEGWEDGWSNGHYVVAVGHTPQHIILSDPSSVHDAYLLDTELDRRWHDNDAEGRIDHFMIVPYGKHQGFCWNKVLPLED